MKNCAISLYMPEVDITNAAIYADSAQEQGQAHWLLASVATEIRALDEALRSLGQLEVETATASRDSGRNARTRDLGDIPETPSIQYELRCA